MSIPPALQPADEIWGELRRHLEWSRGFSLFFLFGRLRATALIRDYLTDALRFRSLPLQRIAPENAEEAPERIVGSVLNAADPLNEIGAPLWVELGGHPDDPAWNQARSHVLAALNERRYLLERDVRRPVILVLPLGYRRTALEIAPDLWSVRTFSADVGEPVEAPGAGKSSVAHEEQHGVPKASPAEKSGPLPPSVLEWDRVKDGDPRRVALPLGWIAVEDARQLGDAWLAHRVAQEVVEVARTRRATESSGDDRDRELGISLYCLGNAVLDLGRLEEAERAYREGLELARKVLAMSGDTPGASRNVSVSLNEVGDVALEFGRLEEAERAYREGLELRRKLLAMSGQTPGALRDVSESLIKVGDVALEFERLDEAARAYREGLELTRKILTASGETPETLRDVSVTLDNVGDVALRPGRLDEAEQAYREGLELRRKFLAMSGETPGALRDVSVSLIKVGDAVRQLGRLEEAERAYRDGVNVCLALRERLGDSRQILDDLSDALARLGGVLFDLGRGLEARDQFREAKELLTRLSLAYPEVAEYQVRLKTVESLIERTFT